MEKKKYLDRERERALIAKYQETNDPACLDELLAAHTAYIQKIASKAFIKFGKIVEYDDLVQEGRIGLIKAIKKFDLGHKPINPNDNEVVTNQALLTYAHFEILAEMQSLYHRSHATHIPAHTLRALQFKVTNPGCNTEERKALAKMAMRAESLDAFTTDANNEKSGDRYGFQIVNGNGYNYDPTFEDGVKQLYSPEVQKALAKLTDEERHVIALRYGLEDGVKARSTYIAQEMGKTVEEVEKMLKRAKRILTKNIDREQAGDTEIRLNTGKSRKGTAIV